MKRRACGEPVRADYPVFEDYHANRGSFLKKLGIGAIALAAAGCSGNRTGGVVPYPELMGDIVCPTPPVETNVTPKSVEVPPPPEVLGGVMIMPEDVRLPGEPPALPGIPPPPVEPEAQDK